MKGQTEQELFWQGEFGDEYTERNAWGVSSRIGNWARMLQKAGAINSSLEFGSNIGLNEVALSSLFPGIQMSTVEINKNAAEQCRRIKNVDVFEGSIFDYQSEKRFDLTFTCGVLIHINPNKLQDVYESLYKYTKKYILINEYYNPTPVEIEYRGNKEKLYKRDFAGEIMDKYPDLELVDYGFIYHRDVFPWDDTTYFLLRKQNV